MPKMKTRRSAAKRFSVTGSGKDVYKRQIKSLSMVKYMVRSYMTIWQTYEVKF